MDGSARYSVDTAALDTAMDGVTKFLDSHWISFYSFPESIQFDQRFAKITSNMFLLHHNMNLRLIPTRRHNKNVNASKQKVIRGILLRIKSNNDKFCKILAAQQTVSIPNYIHGDKFYSSHEFAKEFTCPI